MKYYASVLLGMVIGSVAGFLLDLYVVFPIIDKF